MLDVIYTGAERMVSDEEAAQYAARVLAVHGQFRIKVTVPLIFRSFMNRIFQFFLIEAVQQIAVSCFLQAIDHFACCQGQL